MSDRRRELERLLLTMFAAVPLYGTQTIGPAPLIAFHLFVGAIVARVALGKSPELVPASVMRVLGIAYVLFYPIDVALISRSAIAASTHLVLFIAAFQPIESVHRRNETQRLLTAGLLFIASLATATHVAIVPFVIVFAYFFFHQLIHTSHDESLQTIAMRAAPPPPSWRASGFYLVGTTVIGVLLFPTLPRVRSPFVPGIAAALNDASTGLSDSIDFNTNRTITPDATVVSRVWIASEAIPFFTPLRLRGVVYERFKDNQWLQGRRDLRLSLTRQDGTSRIARPSGLTQKATVQQRVIVGNRLFLPTGTFEVIGPSIYEGPTRDVYSIWNRRDLVSYDIRMARSTAPLFSRPVSVTDYPVTPPILNMARSIIGGEREPMKQAALIERYLSSTFKYVPDPASIGRPISVDEFLLRERRGHCEYFAAGMVALLTSLNIPARIVGGFYGGTFNPLTGYFIIRRADAHAWVEVWNGDRWETFDPTPASLRPGSAETGFSAYASAVGDSITYFWDRYILTFGLADQVALLVDTFARTRTWVRHLDLSLHQGVDDFLLNMRNLAIALASVAALIALIWLARRRRSAFELLRDHLRLLQIEVGTAMTMEEALRELRRRHPQAAANLQPLIELYEEERFSLRSTPARQRIRRRLQEMRA